MGNAGSTGQWKCPNLYVFSNKYYIMVQPWINTAWYNEIPQHNVELISRVKRFWEEDMA